MLVRLLPAVDCTADPHYVDLGDLDKEQIADLILKVCEDPVVWRICSVHVTLGDEDKEKVFESGYWSDFSWSKKKSTEKETGKKAVEDKIEGLFCNDDRDGKPTLEGGLTGVRHALELIKKAKGSFSISIGVYWDEFRQHSCSDYISWPPSEGSSDDVGTVDFSNQDDYIALPDDEDATPEQKERYARHFVRLSKVVGQEIDPSDDPKR